MTAPASSLLSKTLQTIEELNQLIDVDGILDKILEEARAMARADAGSIFLVEGETLKFSFVQNDTLFSRDVTNKVLYADFSVPIDETSIVGFVARTGRSLVIDDAYLLPPGQPFRFNPSFDEMTDFRTQSILTVPLTTWQDRLVGVMELINAMDERGQVIPFPAQAQEAVPLLANKAAAAIERGLMIREQILRMMKMAELRDPSETGAHVQRVGAYSAEIYKRWALNQGLARFSARCLADNPSGLMDEIRRTSGLLRLAAMLHDVGKVGIRDAILKKPARLDPGEFETMKWHTVFGARLFWNATSDLDRMCFEIALYHHEKWTGQGYPGTVLPDLMAADARLGAPLAGPAIPIAARITALADVYDALCSPRAYKDPWPEEKVLAVIEQESGRHFDPDVVEAFFQIHDVIRAIQDKFKEAQMF